MPIVLRKFTRPDGHLGTSARGLVKGVDFPTLHYKKRFLKPNPYTTQEKIQREELPSETHWGGWEPRPGMVDLRPLILSRDNFQCQRCGLEVGPTEAHVDHKRPVSRFKRPVDANTENNLQTLCIPCHKEKTKSDLQAESPVR
jgi:5-methylcytosine-specific restriction enzyme A